MAIYRAAQGALTNVQRHANARQVWTTISVADDRIALAMSDDGRGFPAEAEERDFGLRGVRERWPEARVIILPPSMMTPTCSRGYEPEPWDICSRTSPGKS